MTAQFLISFAWTYTKYREVHRKCDDVLRFVVHHRKQDTNAGGEGGVPLLNADITMKVLRWYERSIKQRAHDSVHGTEFGAP